MCVRFREAPLPMPRFRALLLLALLAPLPVLAQQASDEDIDRLLQASHAQRQLDAAQQQVDANQQQQFQQITAGKDLSDEQKAQLQSIQSRTADTLHQALSWEQMKPLYIDVYRQNFSRDDIRAIAKFYESDAGQHLLDKGPGVTQGVMATIQQKIGPTLTDLETELQQVVDTPVPAPPLSPEQKIRNEVIPESCKKVRVKVKGKYQTHTVCRTSTGGKVVKGKAAAGTAKKKAGTVKKKAAPAKKPAAKKKTK